MWFPTRRHVLELHEAILAASGGERGMLHPTTLDAALARCRFGPFPWTPDIAFRAALLLRGLAADHPFADGNKRTAWEIASAFLLRNGARLHVSDADAESIVLEVATGRVDPPRLAAWLRSHMQQPLSEGGEE